MTSAIGRIQLYVLTRTLLGVGAAFAVIASVIMLIDFVELSRTLGGVVDLTFVQLIGLTLLKSPAVILKLLPFIFLFGVMGAFVALNRRSELVAMRAAGMSAWRFVLPAAAVAFVIGMLTIGALNPAAAWLSARFEDRRADLSEDRRGASHEMWLREGDGRDQMVIHAASHDLVNATIRLQGVSIYLQSLGPGGALVASRRIEASQADLMPGAWRLTDVREALPGAQTVRSERLDLPSALDLRTAMEKVDSPDSIDFWRLPRTIERAQSSGYAVAGYQLRLHQLLATPLLFSAMSVLAAAFSMRLMRLGGLAGLAIVGLAVGFVVFFSNQLCGALGSAGVLPPALAAWAPPVLAFLSGVTVLCYTEDG
ncbi:MAG: LptF/LptG family permease [Proteobacteria bacterium]|nr:LptF/LptG family permease [Pseudomonadota bacterium]